MSNVITYRDLTLNSSTNMLGWDFKKGSFSRVVNEAAAPLAIGYWLKRGNRATATHTLEVTLYSSDPAALLASIESMADGVLGDLVLPVFGTLARCRLSDVGQPEVTRSTADLGYILRNLVLTYTQYP